MRKWKPYSECLADGSDAECDWCYKPVVDMELVMIYTHQLECADITSTKISYGGREDYDDRTELRCSCGKVYVEDKDYRVKREEQDGGWIWTLEVEMEAENEADK